MRRYRLSICLAVALASTSQAFAEPCAIGLDIHSSSRRQRQPRMTLKLV